MGGVLSYEFLDEQETFAIVPYYSHRTTVFLSAPKKHTSEKRVCQYELTETDIEFLNSCEKRAFEKLTAEGYNVVLYSENS